MKEKIFVIGQYFGRECCVLSQYFYFMNRMNDCNLFIRKGIVVNGVPIYLSRCVPQHRLSIQKFKACDTDIRLLYTCSLLYIQIYFMEIQKVLIYFLPREVSQNQPSIQNSACDTDVMYTCSLLYVINIQTYLLNTLFYCTFLLICSQ